MKKKTSSGLKIISINRKASFNFFFEKLYEAGIVLKGSEIKSIRSGKVNIAESYAIEKDGEIIQEDLAYCKENLSIMLKKYDVAVKKLFPNRIANEKFKELRLLNDKLTDSEFADLLNEKDYLTSKGNKFTSVSAYNYKKRLNIGSLGPRKFRTIKEAKNIVIEKLRETSKNIAQNPKKEGKIEFKKRLTKILEKDDKSLIFAKATQLINDEKK